MNNKYLKEFMYILYLFFISSILGGILESFYKLYLFHTFEIGGFMYGPWRPIYGFGCLLLYFITKKIQGSNVKIFFSSMIICTVFEYMSSFMLELIFQKSWWDYSNEILNLNGRICLFHSIIWGLLGVIFLKLIEPFLRKAFNQVEFKKISYFTIFLFVIYHVDSLFSWIRNLR